MGALNAVLGPQLMHKNLASNNSEQGGEQCGDLTCVVEDEMKLMKRRHSARHEIMPTCPQSPVILHEGDAGVFLFNHVWNFADAESTQFPGI